MQRKAAVSGCLTLKGSQKQVSAICALKDLLLLSYCFEKLLPLQDEDIPRAAA